jgi:sterol desaturase/sphingolipid hydroxylase (fatty acid hydroxylase superfamily)
MSASTSLIEILEAVGTWLGAAALTLFLPWELWQLYRRGRLTRAVVREMLASASPYLPLVLTSGLAIAWFTLVLTSAAEISPWALPVTPWSAALAVLAVDFVYYWDHRCNHRVRLLWAVAHSVHHSSPQYDQTIGLRITFLDGFISIWFYAPLALVGFDPALLAAAFGVILGYQQWLHTETIGRLRWLDGWLNTPSNHRVHHGVQPQYLDKNFGAILMIWDRLFGTYQRETVPVIYGLTHPIGSSHPFAVHFHELGRLWHRLRQTRGIGRRARLLFSPP